MYWTLGLKINFLRLVIANAHRLLKNPGILQDLFFILESGLKSHEKYENF